MEIRERLQKYTEKDDRIAAASFFGSFGAYFLTLTLAIANADIWAVLIPMMILNGFCAVRLYVLQHDAGHASMFRSRKHNDWAGEALSVVTFAPYAAMRHNHNLHHAHLGNLEHRETGEIHTMTLREWNAAGVWERLQYRLYRNPFILIPAGSLFTYFIRYRWPKNAHEMAGGVVRHNLMILAYMAVLWGLAGWTGVLIWFLSSFFGGMIGVFMVYLQHNFEDTYWDRKPDLDPRLAALQGSSALDLGWWMDLGSANIAYHDIHHFNARIPHYRLRKCHQEIRREYDLPVIKWPEALRSFSLKLWDEDQERLVPFPRTQAGRATATPAI
ncbi:fatty acid desaturase [Thiosulfatihalobacter marinus]|jgi:omega-6 fatty acid desaturase (delta-12 desaturase)|uniref:fatty acid desaturase n=1 Tax=Thiosulfatihalobacter marinus TaxID=2792481 RepID=UPI0018DA339C|nr:fatty acid desaturase [Thiosulfatihalobacter marinus]